jgi:two-component system chemotaxis response regulator CheB
MTVPVRILVVDDSVVIRKLLSTTLGEIAGLEVVATAALGKIALARIPQCNPDVVILDVEMPEMDGIETLKQIRKIAPRLPVIMFSTRTERGAVATIEALTSGASDYVAKPSNTGSVVTAMARVREEMVPKIFALTAGRSATASAPPPAAGGQAPIPPSPPPAAGAPPVQSHLLTTQLPTFGPTTRFGTTSSLPSLAHVPATTPATTSQIGLRTLPIPTVSRTGRSTANPIIIADGPIRLHRAVGPRPVIEIVAIGASTGGPNALSVMLGQLPADFPVPIVIVQHMLASFTRPFADRLAQQCRLKIVEAAVGDVLAPGCAYIARGDHHLIVERHAGRAGLAMNQDAPENFCRPAADVLFRSVARSHGAGALAVVLTGMGHDGLSGCGAIREAGGDIIVQDEASSVVWGMPGFIARAGLASQVIAIDQLAGELRRRVSHGSRTMEVAP